MQLILLCITILLSVVLYKMLSGYRLMFPYIRVSKTSLLETDSGYQVTETESGMIAVNSNTVIVGRREYALKNKDGQPAEAFLHIEERKLISIAIHTPEEDSVYFIDPEYNLYDVAVHKSITPTHSQRQLLSV